MPWIADPEDADRFLRLHISERRARALEAGVSDGVDGFRDCTCYEYTGDQYGPETCFWIDGNADLLAYRWRQTAGPGAAKSGEVLWEISLKRE